MLKTITAKITEVAAVAVRAVCAFIADARPLLRGFARASVLVVMTVAVAGCGIGRPDGCPGDLDAVWPGHYHTPLYDAAWKGDLDRVKFLVACGADINHGGSEGEDASFLGDHDTPLDAAIFGGGGPWVAKFLVSEGGRCSEDSVKLCDRADDTYVKCLTCRCAEAGEYCPESN